MEVNVNKLPRKIRYYSKEELVAYINKSLRIDNNFLDKLELEELQLLLIQLRRYGSRSLFAGFIVGDMLF